MFAARGADAGRRRVAVVGLGTGTTAAYSNRGEQWTFYEIDPGIQAVASDPRLFRFLSESPARVNVVLGDGRLSVTLEDMKSGRFYQSLVPLEGETLEQIFEHYLSQSEQLSAFLRLQADGGALCGLLLEKLPGADAKDPDGWNRVQHLASTLTLDETRDVQPYDLLTRVFPEELMRVFRLYAVEYHCPYDENKVKDMLRGLGRQEVEAILAEQGEVVIRNEMCNHEYRFDARAIAELFQVH
jgi:molecular chaperone Hsp33